MSASKEKLLKQKDRALLRRRKSTRKQL